MPPRITKTERDAMWVSLADEHTRSREKFPTPSPLDWEIIERDGKKLLVCPWHQELPAGMAELHFWDTLCELRSMLSPESRSRFIDSFLKSDGIEHPDELESVINLFCDWVLETSRKNTLEKERKRLADIEDVRQSCDFYEDEIKEG